MPFCPTCHAEYRRSITHCTDCNVQLTDANPNTAKEAIKQARKDMVYANPVFLCSASYGIESDMLAAALRDEGIPAQVRHRGSGEYMSIFMGASAQGVDIFVPEVALEKAQDIIDAIKPPHEEHAESPDDDFDAVVQKSQQRRLIRGWIFIAIFLGLPTFIALIVSLLFD